MTPANPKGRLDDWVDVPADDWIDVPAPGQRWAVTPEAFLATTSSAPEKQTRPWRVSPEEFLNESAKPTDNISPESKGIPAFRLRNEGAGKGPVSYKPSELPPNLTPPIITEALGLEGKPTSVAGGAAKAAAEFVEGTALNPVNVGIQTATGGLGLLSKLPLVRAALPKAISVAFSADMLKNAYEQSGEFRQALDAGDYPAAAHALTSSVLNAGMSAVALRHAAAPEEPARISTALPAEDWVDVPEKAPVNIAETEPAARARTAAKIKEQVNWQPGAEPEAVREPAKVIPFRQPGEQPAPVEIPTAKELTPPEREAETRYIEKIQANPQAVVDEYRQRFTLPNGTLDINTDNARELSQDYGASKESKTIYGKAVHEPASWVAKETYAQALQEPAPEGIENAVAFTAGGTGAGKTVASRLINPDQPPQILYDTNLNNFESAKTKIDAALDAGKEVWITYVHRGIEDAFRSMLERGMKTGRSVPLGSHVETHNGAPKTLLALLDTYGEDPRVKIDIINNTSTPEEAHFASPDVLRGVNYNGIEQRLERIADEQIGAGQVSPELYRAVLGKEPAAQPGSEGNAQEPTAAGTTQALREPRRPGDSTRYGRPTEILVPGSDTKYRAIYSVRELDDVQASHSGRTFQGNPKFELQNDRDYSDKRNSGRILAQAGDFKPLYLLTDSPDALNGAPIIDERGNVLGGNSRTMTIERVYDQKPASAEAYRKQLLEDAQAYGIDPADIQKMKRPVLVREIQAALKPAEAQKAVTDFNVAGTAPVTSAERAVADSHRVSLKTLEGIARRIEDQGPDGTLAKALGGDGRALVNQLVEDGAIAGQERSEVLNKDGTLTAEGKSRISRLMIGRLFKDPREFDTTAPELRNKLERIVAPLARIEGRGEWDIGPAVKDAIALINETKARDTNLDDLLAQAGMFGDSEHSKEAIQLAKFLSQAKSREVPDAFRNYAAEAEIANSEGIDARLLQAEIPTQSEAFRQAFGEEAKPKTLDIAEAKIKARIKQRYKSAASTLSAGPGLAAEQLADYAALGAIKIAKGVVAFKDWSAEMVKDLGEHVRPYLQEIWTKAQEIHKQGAPTETATPESGPRPSPSYDLTKLNLLKNVSEPVRQQMARRLEDFDARNPERRVVTFEDVRREARELDPSLVDKLDPAKLKQGETLDPAVRFAARETLNGMNVELEQKRSKFAAEASNMTGDERARLTDQIERLEQDARRLVDVLIPTRSQDGRNLAYHRMMAEGSFDVTYWLSRARRAIGVPEGTTLPQEVLKDIQGITGRGQEAESNAVRRVIRETAEREAQAEAGPPPKGDLPTLIERQQRYKQRILDAIQQKMAGVTKDRAPSKWELTPEERIQVDNDPAVKQARIELARKLAKLEHTGPVEAILAFRRAGLLTGIKTHLRNIGGNTAFQALEEVARVPAVITDTAFELFGKPSTVQGPSPRSVARAAKLAGTKGVSEAIEMLKNGALAEDLARLDYQREVNTGNKYFDGAINAVFRSMGAEDRVFKTYAFERSLAERMKLAKVSEPTDAMRAEAWKDALYATFNNENLIATAWATAKGRLLASATPGGKALAVAMDLAVPFVRTPSNIVARIIDYTPVGGLARATHAAQQAITSKGWTPETQRAFSMAIGRGLTGSALLWFGYWLSSHGLATGVSEEDKGLRDVSEAAGRMYGSVLIGGKWRRIDSVSPVGNLIVLGATLQREAVARGDLPAVVGVGLKTVADLPMMQGASQAAEVVTDPARTAARAVASTAASFVPTAVADVAAAGDTARRETRSPVAAEQIKAAVESRIPGLRNRLPERVDVFGNTEAQEWQSVLDPTIGSKAKETADPVLRALVENRVPVSTSPQRQGETPEQFKARKAAHPGAKPKRAETDKEYRDRLKREGGAIKNTLGRVINSPAYERADEETRRQILIEQIARVRSRVI